MIIRKLFVQQQLPGFVKEEDVYELAKDILDLATVGLKERGQGVDLEDIILEYAAIGKQEDGKETIEKF